VTENGSFQVCKEAAELALGSDIVIYTLMTQPKIALQPQIHLYLVYRTVPYQASMIGLAGPS